VARIWIGKAFLGDKQITETTFTEDEDSQRWLEHFISDARNNHHPAFSYVVAEYELLNTETIVPAHPMTLKELGL